MDLKIMGTPPIGKVGTPYEYTPLQLLRDEWFPSYRPGPASFHISPAPPAGLQFDESTGTMSGTPKTNATTTLSVSARREMFAGDTLVNGKAIGVEHSSIAFDLTITN